MQVFFLLFLQLFGKLEIASKKKVIFECLINIHHVSLKTDK